MRVAIAGAGSVGTAIARDLHASGHDVLVLEQDPELVERRRGELDVTWVAADACEVSSLDAAGLATVDVVVAATGDDEDNLVISLLAKQEFAVPRVVARVNNSKNQWLFNESWGVDVSVSTPQLLTALVEEAVSVGSLVRLLQFQGGHGPPGRGDLGRGLAGRRRRPSPTSGIPREATVVAVVRDDRLVVPRGDTVLQAGDEVLVLVTADAEARGPPAASSATRAGSGPCAGGTGRSAPVRIGRRERRPSSTSTRRSSPRRRSPPSAGRSAGAASSTGAWCCGPSVGQLIFLQFGADEDRLVRIRESMLALTKGWDQRPGAPDRARDAARDDRADHLRRGARADGGPPPAGRPRLPRLGLTRGDRPAPGRAARRGRGHPSGPRSTRRAATPAGMAFYAYGPARPTAMVELAERAGIDLSASTAYSDSATDLPCSRRSATRSPSTPTGRWPRWPASGSGRSGSSPSRCGCATA